MTEYVTFVVRLTRDQYDHLSEILWAERDEGPVGEGWASDRLEDLRRAVEAAGLELDDEAG